MPTRDRWRAPAPGVLHSQHVSSSTCRQKRTTSCFGAMAATGVNHPALVSVESRMRRLVQVAQDGIKRVGHRHFHTFPIWMARFVPTWI